MTGKAHSCVGKNCNRGGLRVFCVFLIGGTRSGRGQGFLFAVIRRRGMPASKKGGWVDSASFLQMQMDMGWEGMPMDIIVDRLHWAAGAEGRRD